MIAIGHLRQAERAPRQLPPPCTSRGVGACLEYCRQAVQLARIEDRATTGLA